MNVKKFKKLFLKPLTLALITFSFVAMVTVGYMQSTLPGSYNVTKSDASPVIPSKIPLTAVLTGDSPSDISAAKSQNKSYSVQIKAFGIIPVKKAVVSVIDEKDVIILGSPFGIKIYTEGVMVVGVDNVATQSGKVAPGKQAGIEVGDTIISIDGIKVYSNEEVAEIIEKSNGSTLEFKLIRDKAEFTTTVTPALCHQSNKYKSGIWVRDSSAGIGTLTFYNPTQKAIGGLGHGICDSDTGNLLTIHSGEIVSAEILSVKKGKEGEPGELIGRFSGEKLGDIFLNNESGVYSYGCVNYNKNSFTKIALKHEVIKGKAQIITTVDGTTPKGYDCEIVDVSYSDSSTKNMVVKITDKDLLAITGGIVQGMSGSPLIQNGKLIGAVTHVLVDDPTKGYAIFAENMLETAQSVGQGLAPDEKIKDAS